MKRPIKQNIIIILSMFVVMFGITLFRKCSNGDNQAKSGPAVTLETFYRNLCSGKFESARNLCIPMSMDTYIDRFSERWSKADSAICVTTSDILSGMTINVNSVEKNKDKRSVFYTLTTTDGQSKEKVATLSKEEGEWKIEAIIDKI